MPPLSRKQFWKANPNQMALPGLEEHSHPGAGVLAQGFRFEHTNEDLGRGRMDAQVHSLMLVPHDKRVTPPRSLEHSHGLPYHETHPNAAASLSWATGRDSHQTGLNHGEIGMVETADGHQGKGFATTLYGVGRTMARVKPQHSNKRTVAGDAWAKTTTAKFGGKVPKKNLHDDMFAPPTISWL